MTLPGWCFRFKPGFIRSELNGERHCLKVGTTGRFEWEIFNLLQRICGRVISRHFIPAWVFTIHRPLYTLFLFEFFYLSFLHFRDFFFFYVAELYEMEPYESDFLLFRLLVQKCCTKISFYLYILISFPIYAYNIILEMITFTFLYLFI